MADTTFPVNGGRLERSGWPEQWFDLYYYRRPGWVGGTTAFHALCAQYIAPGCEILRA